MKVKIAAMTRKRKVRCAVYCTLVAMLACFVAHPYTRQLVFGPKIRGVPLCSWQHSVRYHAAKGDSPGVIERGLAWLGIKSPEPLPCELSDEDMLAVCLSLADDHECRVRGSVAYALGIHPRSSESEVEAALIRLLVDPEANVRETAVLSVPRLKAPSKALLAKLRERLDDAHGRCRVFAALGCWQATGQRDEKAVRVLRDTLRSEENYLRGDAANALGIMGKDVPDCYAEILAAANADPVVRRYFAATAVGFGRIAVPFLVEVLNDPNSGGARAQAGDSLQLLGADAVEAIPGLIRALEDPDEGVRNIARAALSKIDPEQYPHK